MDRILHSFKEQLFRGDFVKGPFMKTSDPALVEAAGYAGFDFVILDTEHGPVSIENLQNHIRAALIADILPVIRVPDNSESSIRKVLDIGALGIQVPQIKNAVQAEETVRRAKFYPKGDRGVCRFVRAAKYSALDRITYFRLANETLVILQIEGLEALKNIEEIIAVPGIDVLFIGPYDLSQALGVPGEIGNSELTEKMQYIVNIAREKNIVVGTFVDTKDDVERWKKAGVQYMSYSVDVGIFFDACKAIVDSI